MFTTWLHPREAGIPAAIAFSIWARRARPLLWRPSARPEIGLGRGTSCTTPSPFAVADAWLATRRMRLSACDYAVALST